MPAGTCYASKPSVPSAGARGWAAGREGADEFMGRRGGRAGWNPARMATPCLPATLPIRAPGPAPHTCSSEGPCRRDVQGPEAAVLKQVPPAIPPAAFCSQSHTQQFPASLQKLPSVILIYLEVEKITFCPLLHLYKRNICMQPPFSLWRQLPSGLRGCNEDLPMRWPLGRPPPECEQPPSTATFPYGFLEAGSADPSSVLYSLALADFCSSESGLTAV